MSKPDAITEESPIPAMQPPSLWDELGYRWFVQYNPLYLISAALVLVGVYLTSGSLARSEGMGAELLLTGVTELYQALLIGGAALLTRLGQRRPAVMLALLEVVYSADLTFQTGAAAYLGEVGMLFSAVWFVLFAVKLLTLFWALELRPSPSAVALPLLGALVLAVVPHLLQGMEAGGLLLLCCALFGVVTLGRWSGRRVTCRAPLDDWGRTVLRRALRAAWTTWIVLLVGHSVWWAHDHALAMAPLFVSVLLPLTTYHARTERQVWLAAALSLGLIAHLTPFALASTAAMTALLLALRGLRGPRYTETACMPAPPLPVGGPYRAPEAPPAPPSASQRIIRDLRPAPRRPEARRFYVGATACLYLALFTWGWCGGPLPTHSWPLDLAFSAALLLAALRLKVGAAWVPLLLMHGHGALVAGLFPVTRLHWGLSLLVLGFTALVAGLGVNWRLRRDAPPEHPG